MERPDSFILGVVTGLALAAGSVGLYQLLLTKGYLLAVELFEAGWSARELRAHKKAITHLRLVQDARAQGASQR